VIRKVVSGKCPDGRRLLVPRGGVNGVAGSKGSLVSAGYHFGVTERPVRLISVRMAYNPGAIRKGSSRGSVNTRGDNQGSIGAPISSPDCVKVRVGDYTDEWQPGIEVLPFDEKGKKQLEVEESQWKQMA
jgi:hypothetical protein